jgi:hypothetical protein
MFSLLVWFSGRFQSASEQNDQNNYHHDQTKAPTIVMEWRTEIETATTEKQNENNQ